MSNSFFTLQEPYETLEAPEDFFKLTETSGGLIKDFLYKPEELKGSANKFRRTVKKIKFTNVSFTRTHIESIDFYDCVFEKCLFIIPSSPNFSRNRKLIVLKTNSVKTEEMINR